MAFSCRMIFLTAGVLALFVSLILYLRFSREDAQGPITQSRLDVREHRTQSTEIRDVNDRAAMQAFVDSYNVGQEVTVHWRSAGPLAR
jgi:hypothetical protein